MWNCGGWGEGGVDGNAGIIPEWVKEADAIIKDGIPVEDWTDADGNGWKRMEGGWKADGRRMEADGRRMQRMQRCKLE